DRAGETSGAAGRLERLGEGEPPGEPRSDPARTEPRPPEPRPPEPRPPEPRPAGGQVAYVVRCACDPSSDGSGGQTVVDHIRLFRLIRKSMQRVLSQAARPWSTTSGCSRSVMTSAGPTVSTSRSCPPCNRPACRSDGPTSSSATLDIPTRRSGPRSWVA